MIRHQKRKAKRNKPSVPATAALPGKIRPAGQTGVMDHTVCLGSDRETAEGGAGKDSRDFSGVRKRGRGKLCDSRRDFQHAAEQGRGGTKRMQIHQKSGQNGKQDDVSAKLCNDFKSVHDRGVQQVSFGSLF